MKHVLILLTLALGCSRYTATKVQLVEQVRRGIHSTREATSARQELIEHLSTLQLERLDNAFDADVKQRPTLDAAWVIEHRQAYAAARDALSEQRYSLRRGQETIESNLDLIDSALEHLQLMHDFESKLTLSEVIR